MTRKAVQCASARRYRAAQQAAGLCWSCPTGVPTTNPITGQPFRRCLACRKRNHRRANDEQKAA